MKKLSYRSSSAFELFVNYLMRDGKKERALNLFFKILFILKQRLKFLKKNKSPYNSLLLAIENVRPQFKLISYFKKNKKIIMPFVLSTYGSLSLGIRRLLLKAKLRYESNIVLKVVNEILDASAFKGLSYEEKIKQNRLVVKYKRNLKRFKKRDEDKNNTNRNKDKKKK